MTTYQNEEIMWWHRNVENVHITNQRKSQVVYK